MLQRISIHNLALIRDLELEFCPTLNVLSGETGAGKSIIVDSLMLLMGARYDKTLLKFGEDKGFVEGVFVCDNTAPLSDLGIDADEGMFIVARKFFKDGKNEIRVNGKQVTTAMLRELMQNYVDIYGQNEYQSLLKLTEQHKILDAYVFNKDDSALTKQRELYNEFKRIQTEITKLGDEAHRAQRIDILKYQIEEIHSAKVTRDEEEKLVEKRHLLMASERIKTALVECGELLGSDDGASAAVSAALRALASVSTLKSDYADMYERLNSVSIELDDLASCVCDELSSIDSCERELEGVLARLEKLRALKSKYGAFDAMQLFVTDAVAELEILENGAAIYDKLMAELQNVRTELYENCVKLSNMRRKSALEMENRILAELADLGMAKSKFRIEFSTMPSIEDFAKCVTAAGFDECEFYLSPNAGQPLLPLAKIISGGEMSRFILAVKLVTGDAGSIGTMIFDEIDTGISGAIGLAVAKKLCIISRAKQVLCVTHLPQIAAMADRHYFIDKSDDDNNETKTSVTLLDADGRVGEIARLSGTRGVSAASDQNALETIKWCEDFKHAL